MSRSQGASSVKHGLEEAKRELLRLLKEGARHGTAPASFPVIVRVKVPLIDMDLLEWLSGQHNSRKVFWSSSDGALAVAGIGAAFEAAPEGWYGFNDAWAHVSACMAACPEARFFAGMSFARTVTGPEWRGFPAMRFILPAVEMIRDAEGFWLAANIVRDHDGGPFSADTGLLLERMCVTQQVMPAELLPVSREDVPDYDDWVCSAETVLESLEKEGLEKVVLARRVSFQVQGGMDGGAVLEQLMGQQKADFSFLFGVDGSSFIGMSSDPLYVRQGARVESRAVAGGRPRGKDKLQDDVLREALLSSDKDLKEHRLVAGALVEVFREFCRSYQVDCERGPAFDALSVSAHALVRYP